MKSLIILILVTCFVAISLCDQQNGQRLGKRRRLRPVTPEEKNQFTKWRKSHRKRYRSQAEEEEAMEKLLTNKEKIDQHNKLFKEGRVTFTRGLWEHSDMSDEDKQKYLMGLTLPPEPRSHPSPANIPQYPIGPASVNWREKGLVGPVEDQGK